MTTGFTTQIPVPKISERYKAAYDPVGTSKPKRRTFYSGQFTWRARCDHYDKLVEEQPLLKRALFTYAGMVVAQGVFFKPSETKPKREELEAGQAEQKITEQKQKRVAYAVAEDAAEQAEKFKRDQQIISKFWETTYRASKYGGCFWEITYEPVFSFRIPTLQECIEPAEADDQGVILRWKQIVNGQLTAEWQNGTELILIPFLGGTTATWPYSPSLLAGLETESEMLTSMEESVKDYSEKQAWPYEILALGDSTTTVSDDDYQTARIEWKNRQPGEGIATRNMPVDIKAGGTGSAPIRELAVLCELMKDNVVDGTMIPPISKLYNSTEASAREMTKFVMTALGQPWQWRLAENFEEAILKNWLEASGFSRKSCPQTLFESPDVHKKEEGEYWTSLVQAQIQTPAQACEHLGLDYDEEYFTEKQKMEQEQMQKQLDVKAGEKPKEENAKPENREPIIQEHLVRGESFLVTKVRTGKHGSLIHEVDDAEGR